MYAHLASLLHDLPMRSGAKGCSQVLTGLHLALCGIAGMGGCWGQSPGSPMSCQTQVCTLGGAVPGAGILQGWRCLLMLERRLAAVSAGPRPAQDCCSLEIIFTVSYR